MKTYIVGVLMICGLLVACEPVDRGVDTGISNGKHDCSMYDYFLKDSKNWSLLVEMINHAGLQSLFKGTDPQYPEITFWGPTNMSIQRYLWENNMKSVADMDASFCAKVIMMHVVKGVRMKESFNFRIPDESGKIVGASELTTEGNVNLWVYQEQEEYGGVADAGATHLFLYSRNTERHLPLGSPDIKPLNGVVHSLNYNYTLGDMVTETEWETLKKGN